MDLRSLTGAGLFQSCSSEDRPKLPKSGPVVSGPGDLANRTPCPSPAEGRLPLGAGKHPKRRQAHPRPSNHIHPFIFFADAEVVGGLVRSVEESSPVQFFRDFCEDRD